MIQRKFSMANPNITTPWQLDLRIHWLYPLQWVRFFPQEKESPGYNIKLHLMVRLQFWRSEECWLLSSLTLIPGPLWLKVVVPVRLLSMGQTDLFKNYLVLISLFNSISTFKNYLHLIGILHVITAFKICLK